MEEQIKEYCKKYNIPFQYLVEILEDQKVVPMIRGKATEYNVYIFLKENLDSMIWDVQKLNLNAQNNNYDEDISITHRRTGIRLKVEAKNAKRDSFKTGKRTKKSNNPHFEVKCHRSRSNMKKADTTNDKYIVGEFDLLVSNTSNAIYMGGTIDENLQVTDNIEAKEILYNHYEVNNDDDLIKKCNNDWRFAIPSDIAEKNGSLPRNPVVLLKNDTNWFDITTLNERLIQVVKDKKSRIVNNK